MPRIILLIIILSAGCGRTNEVAKSVAPADRAAIEARLVPELSPDTSRAGRQRNAIINYAIDETWDVQAAPEGYFYQITSPGVGMEIMPWDEVRLHYQGRYLDGTIFDDSRRRNQKITFRVGQMIPAWNLALLRLAPGGSLRLLVPSELAYGAEGLLSANGDTLVGAHRILVFELDALEVTQRRFDEEM